MIELFKTVDSKASTAKPKISRAVENSLKQGGAKGKTLFDKFKSAKFVGKLGGMLGKLQLKAPVHLIDSMITYAIGVVSGMQDMAQVRMFCQLILLVCRDTKIRIQGTLRVVPARRSPTLHAITALSRAESCCLHQTS